MVLKRGIRKSRAGASTLSAGEKILPEKLELARRVLVVNVIDL